MGRDVMRKFLLILMATILIFFSGCKASNNPPGNQAAPPQDVKKTERVPQTAAKPDRNKNPQNVARRLANLAARVPQVNDATVVIFGKYAIVGIDVNAVLDRSRVGVIKYTVAEALKDDPLGANALVTADPDIVQRLREINADLKRGHPIQGLVEELSDIVGRIIPQTSKDVQKKENPPTKENQQKLNQTNQTKNLKNK